MVSRYEYIGVSNSVGNNLPLRGNTNYKGGMMFVLVDGKTFKYKDLKPKGNCQQCGGSGYVAIIRPDLDAMKFREMRPCPCVKKVVKVKGE